MQDNCSDMEINVGDEVLIKNNDKYDILTVLKINNQYAECFEYDPRRAFLVSIKELERI